MKGMDEACQRIMKAIDTAETIGVFSDYDVDGVCSAALIHRFLVGVGCKPPVIFIPDRTSDGYGLNTRGIDELHGLGVTLMLTADCGITAREEVGYANSLGMDVIVTDHHEVDQQVPDACSVINPKQSDCLFFGEDLCGAGVVFHLIVALRAHLRERGIANLPNLKEELDIVAMATVADAVALSGLNRVLVKEGLAVLNSTLRWGSQPWSRWQAFEKNSYRGISAISSAPGSMPQAVLRMPGRPLTCSRPMMPARAHLLAQELDSLNRQRQVHEQRVLGLALGQLRNSSPPANVIVAWGRDWHIGVLGIVASRLASLYSRPALVISVMDGIGIGSGRSIPGVDLHGALARASSLLNTFGGHKMAVGLSIAEERIPLLPTAMDEIIGSQVHVKESPFEVDLKISPYDLTPTLLDELELLAPFGEGNPEPVFLIPSMEIVGSKVFDNGQTKLVLRHSNRLFHTLRSPVGNGFMRNGELPGRGLHAGKDAPQWHDYLYLSLKALAASR
jgi:single-stranded-DNA-specific exonuclease